MNKLKFKRNLNKELNKSNGFEKFNIDVNENKKSKYFGYKLVSPIISFALIIFLLFSFFSFSEEDDNTVEGYNTHLLLEINPSFEIILDEELLVEEVKALNEDAVYALYDQDLDFVTLNQALLFLENRLIELEFDNESELNFNYAFLTKAAEEEKVEAELSQLFLDYKEDKPNLNFINTPKENNESYREFFSEIGRNNYENFNEEILNDENLSQNWLFENIFNFEGGRRNLVERSIRGNINQIRNQYSSDYELIDGLEDFLEEDNASIENNFSEILLNLNTFFNKEEVNLDLNIITMQDLHSSKTLILNELEEYEEYLENLEEEEIETFFRQRGRNSQ